MRTSQIKITRRHTLLAGGLAAALATTPALRRDTAAMAIQRSVMSGGGIAGGGVVAVDGGGEANFSVFGSRFVVEDQDEPLIFGSLIWTDADGTSLVSTEVTAYGPGAGAEETTRQMSGLLTMDGEGNHPFTLTLVDGGGPGEGSDALTLTVQPEGATPAASPVTNDAAYSADAALTSGDLQLLTFDFEE